MRSRTAYVVLGMLSIEPKRSGYDIRRAIESSVGYFWGESYGQIYPALKQLSAEGLIAKCGTLGKQRRQEYSITGAGTACLREWLALPFQNDPPRNEFLLKLFFGREASPDVVANHIRELQRRNQQSLQSLLEIQSLAPRLNADNPHLPYWMLTLHLGIAITKAAIDWSESALATVSCESNADLAISKSIQKQQTHP